MIWQTSVLSLFKFFLQMTQTFFHSEDLSIIEITVNEELAGISQWLKVNRLSLNIKKTQYMIFTRKDGNAKVHLQIDNQEIFETKAHKFLGVFIDNRLNWKIHLAYISGKIARGIGILIKVRGYFNNDCMKCLYYSFIYPYLMYCNHIWGNTYKKSLSKLQLLQNKAVRVITGSNPRTNTELLYNRSGLHDLNDTNLYLVGLFMHKSTKEIYLMFSVNILFTTSISITTIQ